MPIGGVADMDAGNRHLILRPKMEYLQMIAMCSKKQMDKPLGAVHKTSQWVTRGRGSLRLDKTVLKQPLIAEQ